MPAPYHHRPLKREREDSAFLTKTIVHLHEVRGMSFAQIAAALAKRGIVMSRVAVCQRYLRHKRAIERG